MQCTDHARGRFFAGFTSSWPFQSPAISIVPSKGFHSTPLLLGMSSFLHLSFPAFGCGKAIFFDDLSPKDLLNKTLQVVTTIVINGERHVSNPEVEPRRMECQTFQLIDQANFP